MKRLFWLTLFLIYVVAPAGVILATKEASRPITFTGACCSLEHEARAAAASAQQAIIDSGDLGAVVEVFVSAEGDATCFLKSEAVDGLSKTCFYDCWCGTKALNKKAYELCPLTAKFEC